jgi:hypothetical protein
MKQLRRFIRSVYFVDFCQPGIGVCMRSQSSRPGCDATFFEGRRRPGCQADLLINRAETT